MDFVVTTDIARANLLAAEAAASDVVLNVASGVETSLLELAQTLLHVMESDLQVEFGPARTVNNVARRIADTSAARETIGFQATISLDAGLRDLVTWWRSEQEAAIST